MYLLVDMVLLNYEEHHNPNRLLNQYYLEDELKHNLLHLWLYQEMVDV
jgi:hypothetical protein